MHAVLSARTPDRARRLPTRGAWLLVLAILGGCAGQGTTRTGFLSSYDDMAPTPDHTRDLIFVAPAYERGRYTRLVIEDVAWRPAPDTPERSPEEVAQLQDAFHRSLADALGTGLAIVPGDATAATGNTLRLRAAITNTRRANWWINLPAVIAGLPPPNPGGASVEIEVLDAATRQRMVAIGTYANGVPWSPLGYVQRFGHARRAFDRASALLREQLALGGGGA